MTACNPANTSFSWGVYYPDRAEMELWETRVLARTVARDMRQHERVIVLSPRDARQFMDGLTGERVTTAPKSQEG